MSKSNDLVSYYSSINTQSRTVSERPDDPRSWHSYFIGLAEAVATRATCDRAHVGVVFVIDRRVVVTGYNGAVQNADHCDDVGHLMIEGHCKRTVHAEANAICDAAKRGIALKGSSVYLTHTPCFDCAKLLVSVGVSSVYCKCQYRVDDHALKLLQDASISFHSID